MSRRAALGLALLLAACGRRVAPPVTPADLARAQAQWPDTDDAELTRGRQLLTTRCGGCHLPPMPTDVPAPRWPAVLDEMAPEAGLAITDRQALERYLRTLATP